MKKPEFGTTEFDQQIIKNLNLTEDEVISQNVAFKLMNGKGDYDFAFAVSERIFDESMRIKEEEKSKEKQVPFWEKPETVMQQVRKFY
jgi:hypothetical protein